MPEEKIIQTNTNAGSPIVIANALNKSLAIFCSYGEKSFDEVMTNGLLPIADAADLTRVIVYRYVNIEKEKRLKQIFRWDREAGGLTDWGPVTLPNNQTVQRWLSILMQDRCINQQIRDMADDEVAFLQTFGIKSAFMAPIFTCGEFWGCVIFLDHITERAFAEDHMDFMWSAARICSNTIIHAEMEREIAEKNELNSVMFNAAPVGLSTFDDNCNFLNCNETVLAMYGVTKQYYLDNYFNLSPGYQPDGIKSRDKMLGVMKRALGGEKLVLEWMHCTPSGDPVPCEITLMRIKQGERYIGLNYVYDLRHVKKMEEDIRLLRTEAKKVYYDALTGIYNRRYFDENLNRVIRSLSRPGGMLSLMMIDIDFFKNYNDTYGHSEGDTCLVAVADILSKSIPRTDDFVARYGGEEFAVVLPNTDEGGARIIAEKLLENTRNCSIPHGQSAVAKYVTVSIGVTTGRVDHTQKGNDFVKRADEMLYLSKQNGRNRYSFASLLNYSKATGVFSF